MPKSKPTPTYADGRAYERQMGQWSHSVGMDFIDWLALPSGLRWLDVGCGTGAASAAILEICSPHEVVGVDPSEGQVAFADSNISESRAQFLVGDAQSLDFEDNTFDVAVAALLLNLVPDTNKVVAEMRRVVRPLGTVAAYVWDTAGGGHLMGPLVTALKSVDPETTAGGFGRAVRGEDDLLEIFAEENLSSTDTQSFEVLVRYESVDDYWDVVMHAQGQHGNRIRSLDAQALDRLRQSLFEIVPPREDGTVTYTARIWAIRGLVSEA